MTTINTQEDFLRALAENPQWKAAVRAQILDEELLQLPAKFDAFVEEQKQHNARIDTFVEEQKQHNTRFDAFVEEQKQHNARIDTFVEEQKQHNARIDAFAEEQKRLNEEQRQHNARMDAFVEQMTTFVKEQKRVNDRMDQRMDRFSNDIGQVKGGHARFFAVQDSPGIVMDLSEEKNLDLRYVRDVTKAELGEMAHRAAGGDIPTNELRSFRRADLVIEAMGDDGPCYIAVEASFTATQRDASRARRNAALLYRFTGRPCHAVVSSVRNDRNAQAEIAAGNVWWHELEERDTEPE